MEFCCSIAFVFFGTKILSNQENILEIGENISWVQINHIVLHLPFQERQPTVFFISNHTQDVAVLLGRNYAVSRKLDKNNRVLRKRRRGKTQSICRLPEMMTFVDLLILVSSSLPMLSY